MNRRLGIVIFSCIAVAVLLYLFVFNEEAKEIPEVPLGVEHAVTIAYNGPELEVKPYKFGVPVNLRIAGAINEGEFTIYDVRYLLNAGGEFDITQYLMAKDGSALRDLPPFRVMGLEKLSQGMDTHIEQVEKMGVHIWHYYYEVMALVIALWIVWLLLLIFYGHPQKEIIAEPEPQTPFEELLIEFIQKMESGSMDDLGKAQLEMQILNWWKSKLGLDQEDMCSITKEIKVNPYSREAAALLEKWIHDPNSAGSTKEVVASLKPFTKKSEVTKT